eukprot:365861-Chlamydomonas_euryale.AAC.20
MACTGHVGMRQARPRKRIKQKDRGLTNAYQWSAAAKSGTRAGKPNLHPFCSPCANGKPQAAVGYWDIWGERVIWVHTYVLYQTPLAASHNPLACFWTSRGAAA